jgi:hypothetical protein
MTTKIDQAVTREHIMALLTDGEVAKVSGAEAARRPVEGDEYIDLQSPGSGVHQVHAVSAVHPGHILPRSAVSDATWARILQTIGR